MHAADVMESMERDLFPVIGAYPVIDIDKPLLLAALNKVEDRGAVETARRLRRRAEHVFKFARAAGGKNADRAVDVKVVITALPKKRRWPAITDLDPLRRLVADVDVAGASPVTEFLSRLLALTARAWPRSLP